MPTAPGARRSAGPGRQGHRFEARDGPTSFDWWDAQCGEEFTAPADHIAGRILAHPTEQEVRDPLVLMHDGEPNEDIGAYRRPRDPDFDPSRGGISFPLTARRLPVSGSTWLIYNLDASTEPRAPLRDSRAIVSTASGGLERT